MYGKSGKSYGYSASTKGKGKSSSSSSDWSTKSSANWSGEGDAYGKGKGSNKGTGKNGWNNDYGQEKGKGWDDPQEKWARNGKGSQYAEWNWDGQEEEEAEAPEYRKRILHKVVFIGLSIFFFWGDAFFHSSRTSIDHARIFF